MLTRPMWDVALDLKVMRSWLTCKRQYKSIEQFLDKLPTADGYDYAIEFRHPSWGTEGPWEMLRHYNIAAVMTVIMAERQSLTQCKFKEMIGVSLSTDEKRVMEKAKGHILGN